MGDSASMQSNCVPAVDADILLAFSCPVDPAELVQVRLLKRGKSIFRRGGELGDPVPLQLRGECVATEAGCREMPKQFWSYVDKYTGHFLWYRIGKKLPDGAQGVVQVRSGVHARPGGSYPSEEGYTKDFSVMGAFKMMWIETPKPSNDMRVSVMDDAEVLTPRLLNEHVCVCECV